MIIVPSNVGGRTFKNLTLTLGSTYSSYASNIWGMAATPDGSALYATDNSSNAALNKWPINSDGTLGTRYTLLGSGYGVGMAASNSYVVRPNYGGAMDIVSTATFTVTATIASGAYDDFYGSPAIAPDSSAIVHGNNGNRFAFWSTSGSLLGYSNLGVAYRGAVFSPDSSKVYFLGSDGNIHGHYTSTRNRFSYANGTSANQHRNAIAISPDGNRVYTCDSGSTSLVCFTTTSNTLSISWTSAATLAAIHSIAASPDGSRVYCANSHGNMYAFNSITGAQIGSTLAGVGPAYGMALSPDGGTAYVGQAVVRVVT